MIRYCIIGLNINPYHTIQYSIIRAILCHSYNIKLRVYGIIIQLLL